MKRHFRYGTFKLLFHCPIRAVTVELCRLPVARARDDRVPLLEPERCDAYRCPKADGRKKIKEPPLHCAAILSCGDGIAQKRPVARST
ncbi:MAG TPA: hypothetical protein VFE47_31725, partial [Tepidisphaeraceae bacterium]|nr:hypothetical protein [Tepidisphaeraceae bacterium]